MSLDNLRKATDGVRAFKQAQGGKRRKTWADTQGIQSGVLGDVVKGITICERNRATTYERFRQGVMELRWYLQNNYRDKGVKAVLYGIDNGVSVQYAVFVEDGWIRDVGDETRCAHCVAERRR